jgi:hypothetical protein
MLNGTTIVSLQDNILVSLWMKGIPNRNGPKPKEVVDWKG